MQGFSDSVDVEWEAKAKLMAAKSLTRFNVSVIIIFRQSRHYDDAFR